MSATTWVRDHAPTPSGEHLLLLGLITSAAILVASGVSLWLAFDSRADREANARADKVEECQVALVGELVLAPEADALRVLALFGADAQEFEDAVSEIDTQSYTELSALSRTDPDAFVAACQDANLID